MQTRAVWCIARKIREVLAEKDLHDLQEIRLRNLFAQKEIDCFLSGKEGGVSACGG